MTRDDQLYAEYLKREALANALPEGADPKAICEEVADGAGVSVKYVADLVASRTTTGGAG